MALNKDVLGLALYNKRVAFNDKTYDDLVQQYGTIEAARLAACEADAEAIIDHFKNNGVLIVPAAGLIAPSGGGAVTGQSQTGHIQ